MDDGGSGNLATATCTFNGNSMTQIDTQTNTGMGVVAFYYALTASDVGTHNIVLTIPSSTQVRLTAATYIGARTLVIPDAKSKGSTAGGATTFTGSNTSTVDNCWTILCGDCNAGGLAASTNSTLRGSINGGNCGLFDSNATVTKNVAFNMTVTFTAGRGAWVIFSLAPSVSSLFWVGGTGTWDSSTLTHWAASSGGTGGVDIPISTTTVTFDASSGGGTATLSGSQNAGSITCTGYTGNLAVSGSLTIASNFTLGTSMTLSGSSALTIGGNLTLTSGMTYTYSGAITFNATATSKTITTATKSLTSNLTFNGVGGGWTLQDALTTTGSLTLTNGSLNLGNQTVSVASLSSANSNTRVLTLGSGTLTLTGTGTVWDLSTSASMTLTANTSTIKLTDASGSSKTFAGGSLTYNNLYITGSGSGAYTISGSNTFNDFKVDTPPHTVNFTAGTTQSIQTFTVNGTAGNLMTLQSTSAGTAWNLYKTTSGNVVCDYLSLQDSHASSI